VAVRMRQKPGAPVQARPASTMKRGPRTSDLTRAASHSARTAPTSPAHPDDTRLFVSATGSWSGSFDPPPRSRGIELLPPAFAVPLGLAQQSGRRHVEPIGEQPQGAHADIAFAALGIADVVGAHPCQVGQGFLGQIARLAQRPYRLSQGAMAGAERRHSGTLPDPAGEVHQLSGWFPCRVLDQFQTELGTYRNVRTVRGTGGDRMKRRRTIDTTRALSHPVRRRMLRRLNAERRPCSSIELAREAGLQPGGATVTCAYLRLAESRSRSSRKRRPIRRQLTTSPMSPRTDGSGLSLQQPEPRTRQQLVVSATRGRGSRYEALHSKT